MLITRLEAIWGYGKTYKKLSQQTFRLAHKLVLIITGLLGACAHTHTFIEAVTPCWVSSPPHFDVADVCVEVQQGPNADGLSHYLVELRPLGRVQIEYAQDELSELRAVPVRDWSKGATHDLQHQGRQVLGKKKTQGLKNCAWQYITYWQHIAVKIHFTCTRNSRT